MNQRPRLSGNTPGVCGVLEGLANLICRPCRALQGLAYLSYLSIFHDWPCFSLSSLHQWTRVDTGNHSFSRAISCHVVPSYQTAIPQIEAHCSVLRNLRSVRSCLPNSGWCWLCWHLSRCGLLGELGKLGKLNYSTTLPGEVGAMYQCRLNRKLLQPSNAHTNGERERETHMLVYVNIILCIKYIYI